MEKYDKKVNARIEKLIADNLASKKESLEIVDHPVTGFEPAFDKLSDCLHLLDLTLSFPGRANELPWDEVPSFLPASLSILALNNMGIRRINNLDRLTNLRHLSLDYNNISRIENLQSLVSLEALSLNENQIERIENLETLNQLKYLSLDGNTIQRIENLDFFLLESLSLEQNKIAKIENLESLVLLTRLSLGRNNISLVENLGSMEQLEELDLSRNQIEKIENLGTLKKLKSLNLNSNKIGRIENLTNLTNLKSLYAHTNRITKIENLGSLVNLQVMALGNNQITKIEGLHNLHSLTQLYLQDNQIQKIENLESVSKLETLYLSKNQIAHIENIDKLSLLKGLNLSENPVRSIPLSVLENQKLSLSQVDTGSTQGLSLRGCPLENPPLDVLKQGREFAIDYLKNRDKKPLNECKVIIIGRGAVGKTSLQKRIVNDEDFKASEKETHGIRKISWRGGIVSSTGQPITVHFWDFGGQHIQQTLHQFFYSENTLYILVLDRRKDESPEDFLELIKVYGNNAPVIIVYNNKKDLKSRRKFEYELEPDLDSALRNKYSNIKKTIGLCCGQKNDEGVNRLREYLQQLIPGLDHVKETYPANWLNIKNGLVTEVSKNYISFDAYEELCAKQNLDKIVIQKSLAKMLNDIGVITFFDKEFVGEYYILNPDWLTTGAYQIMLSSVTRDKKGKINYKDLKQIFSDKDLAFHYKPREYQFLLSLMKEFNLCHEFGKNEWLIPSSLETQSKTDLVEYKKDKYRLYRIKFETSLPSSIIHRFVARNIDYAHNDDYWKNGILVKHPYSNTFMYVEADQKDKEIRLWIKGDQIRDCWEFFRKDFREFSGKFDPAESVEIDEQKKIDVKYSDLVDLMLNGRAEWYVPGYGDINVKETLGLFEKPAKGKSARAGYFKYNHDKKMLAFISYSRHDGEDSADGANYLEEFKTALTPLIEYNDVVSTWDDTLLIPGDNWDDRITEQLEEADIIFVLISNHLLKTNYIKNKELKIAFDREARGECIVVPIIIKDCGWKDIPWISKIHAIPRKGGTISSWKKKYTSKDEAWNHVYDEVKKTLENFNGK